MNNFQSDGKSSTSNFVRSEVTCCISRRNDFEIKSKRLRHGTSEIGICDGMSNCHLSNECSSQIEIPKSIPSHMCITRIPIRKGNSSCFQRPIELQTVLKDIYATEGSIYRQNHRVPTSQEYFKNTLLTKSPKPYYPITLYNEEISHLIDRKKVQFDMLHRDHYINHGFSFNELFKNHSVAQNIENLQNKNPEKSEIRNEALKFDNFFRNQDNQYCQNIFYGQQNYANYLAPPKKLWMKNYFINETKKPNDSIPTSLNFTPSNDLIRENSASAIPAASNFHTSPILTNTTLDESALQLSTSGDSSGYVTSNNASLSCINLSYQNANNSEDIEIEKAFVGENLSQHNLNSISLASGPAHSLSHARRRTISSNGSSNNVRSPSTVRAGTREVHNKLEKNRRAHLKECFEALKKQLPITPDEKKTSNLSILGAAIRHIQGLKRKEREYEHEMERLAKEKIASQNRILCLKRELQNWDIDFTKILPELTTEVKSGQTKDSSNIGVERLNNSSLNPAASVINNPSESSENMNSLSIISPALASSSSMVTQRVIGVNQISSTASKKVLTLEDPKSMNNNGSNTASNLNSMPLPFKNVEKFNLKSNENSIQSLPFNIQTTKGPIMELTNQMINPKFTNGYTLSNEFVISKSERNVNYSKDFKPISNSTPVFSTITTSSSPQNSLLTSSVKLEQIEPPTKVIKLIGNNAILAPIDKDNKLVHPSGHLALQQLVGGNGLVVSPMLVATPQSLKVIGQPNGLTTIELNSSQLMKGRPKNVRSQFATIPQQGSFTTLDGNGFNNAPPTLNIPYITTQHGSQRSNNRITPGGAELNLLPSPVNGNGGFFQNQGKLAIVKEMNRGSQVRVVHSTPVVVSQPQNLNFTTAISQKTGQLVTTGGLCRNPNPLKQPLVIYENSKNSSFDTNKKL